MRLARQIEHDTRTVADLHDVSRAQQLAAILIVGTPLGETGAKEVDRNARRLLRAELDRLLRGCILQGDGHDGGLTGRGLLHLLDSVASDGGLLRERLTRHHEHAQRKPCSCAPPGHSSCLRQAALHETHRHCAPS